jgi:hypothetical protein
MILNVNRGAMMSDETKLDPFDSADLYTCIQDEENIAHETPADAILELYEGTREIAPMVVYAFKRKTVDDEWVESEGANLSEKLIEDFEDEFGGENNPLSFAGLFASSVREALKDIAPYHCDQCGRREYSAEQVANILSSRSEKR